ncbi:arabinosyltransferase domain-containing protein [Actinomycetospora endophytica]|uniref:Arabinosyltransferase domain-containing protein n=1 Tax=Actinomycetospora endophytica TaxID=2291215 RepID=A0ABS8PCI3_9PSEU|nr:arabinosyltransferase domain-containing protein [Actinomycetospora endophytica]MCD2195996.1 arabinosyltransferase domain-containing protein [Actinomycetospora endophytica]
MLAALVTGIAAAVVAAQVPGAPVESSTSTVTWPREGQAPKPTTMFLVPYRPASLDATVPCSDIRAAKGRPAATTMLATVIGAPADGLVVRTRPASGTDPAAVEVIASGRVVPVDVPADRCDLRIHADSAGLTVTVGNQARPAVTLPGDPVPQVFAATTDLTGADATGLALTARTPSWFDNAPTPQKTGLIAAQYELAAVALLLVVLARLLTPTEPPGRTFAELRAGRGLAIVRTRARRTARRLGAGLRRPVVAARLAVDAGVALTLAWWSIVGPLTDDDGFASVIARQIGDGDVANYYRWFDASEQPFASGQRVLSLFTDQGIAPIALRTPSVLAGFALWLVLTRGVLRPLLGAAGRSVAVRVLAALALGVWWLPYDLGTRPEALVALGTTVVAALVLRAADGVDRPRAHPVALIAGAVLVAGLTVTVAPSGLLAAAPFVLCLPRLLRALTDPASPREEGRVARVTRVLLPVAHLAVIAGLATVAVVVVFAHQSWHGVQVATDIHQQIGPNQPWYAEWLRYGYLFGEDSWGAAAKRVPVIVGLVLAGTGLVLLARGSGRDGVLGRGSVLLLGLLPVGFGLLAVTPSKWSHHFGALAGYGAIGVVAVLVALWRAARERDPVVAATGGAATLALALGAAFAFAGPNAWWGYSGFGMPGATGPQRPFDSPVLWLALAVGVAAAAVVVRWLRPGRDVPDDGGTDDGVPDDRGAGRVPVLRSAALAAAPLVPAMTAVAVALTSVLLLVSSFSTAADRGGRYSLGEQNRAAVADPTSPAACGLQDRVQVLQTAPGGPLTPAGDSKATMTGFVADGGAIDPPPRRPDQTDGSDGTADTRDARYSWGSHADGDGTVGTLTTPWFGLPRPRAGQELGVDVAGRTSDGESLTWEFQRGDRLLGSRPVTEPAEPDRGYRGYAADARQAGLQDRSQEQERWRTVTLTPDEIPDGADQVRLHAVDDRTDSGGWVALTGPRIIDVVPLDRWLARRAPVLVDWAVAFAWPCAGALPRVGDGVAQTPGAFITAPTAPDDPLPGERTTNTSPPGDIVPERWTLGPDSLATGKDSGGSFAGLAVDGSLRELDTRLPDEPGRRWGRVLVPDFEDLGTDGYDVARDTRTTPGTTGDPSPVVDPESDSAPTQSTLR